MSSACSRFARAARACAVAVLLVAALAFTGCGQQTAFEPSGSDAASTASASSATAAAPLDETRLFEDTAPAEGEDPATVDALAFDSDGSTIYGQIMVPAESYGSGRPCVILFHGFAGFTRFDDVAQALCRAGAVVIVPHHRGAWGSEGTYSFSHCIEDAVNLANYAHSDDFCDTYGIDPDRIVLMGHSMGGNTALNAAGELDFVRAVVLMAPCDISYLYQTESADELRTFLVDNGAGALATDGLNALVDDVAAHAESWRFPAAASRIDGVPVFVATGDLDAVCPPDEMVDPLMDALDSQGTDALRERRDYSADHSLVAARVQIARDVAAFLNQACA